MELLTAVRQDDIARISALIESGADVNCAAPKTGYTPLMWAKSAVATRMLIDAGADVHARDHQGHTPLMWVISKYNVPEQAVQIAKELIDLGRHQREIRQRNVPLIGAAPSKSTA